MLLDKKNLLKMWHNPGLNFTILLGPAVKFATATFELKPKQCCYNNAIQDSSYTEYINGNNIINNNIILVSTIFQRSSKIRNIIH